MFLQCQCGSIAIPLRNAPPENEIPLYICHCTQCRLQSSSLFGTSAIFPAAVIFPLSDASRSKLSIWTRPTKQGRSMDCYFCTACGTRVMHRIREADGIERTTVTLKGGCVFLDPDPDSNPPPHPKGATVDSDERGVNQRKRSGEPRGLDFSGAIHLYTAHAVVDLDSWPGSGRRWEGSPEAMEGRPEPANENP